jgi:transketolase
MAKVNEMIRTEGDTVFLTVDLGMWMIRDLLRDYPDRAMNIGICEDGMISIAAGMALRGLIPTIYGIQPYVLDRALEQIKLDLAYQKVGVNIVGTGAAVDYSKYGYSHYCPEDVSLIKAIPGVEFVAPGTGEEFRQLFQACYRNGHPTVFRISDHPNQESHPVEFGKATLIKEGSGVTVIAVSVMLDAVLEACKDKDVTILYYTTLAPFDQEALRQYSHSPKILICEPHYRGSLTYDVVDALPNQYLQIRNVGFPREIFRNYGTYADKLQHYGLTTQHIRKELDGLLQGASNG